MRREAGGVGVRMRRRHQAVLFAPHHQRGQRRSRQATPQQATPQTPQTLQPQTRLAYTALAGVLIAGLAATNTPNTTNTTSAVPGRNPGEHAD